MAIKISGTTVIDDSRNLTNINSLAEATWEAGTSTTETVVSPAKVKAAINALSGWVEHSRITASSQSDIDFTSIPAGINEIRILFEDLSMSGTDFQTVQLGTTSGFTTSGYNGSGLFQASFVTTNSDGFRIYTNSATYYTGGVMTLTKGNGDRWFQEHGVEVNGSGNRGHGAGWVSLAAELDRVRITGSTTNTFDTGAVTLLYRT